MGTLAEAEDVVADVFAKLLVNRNRFEKVENIQAYLYASTRNAAINRSQAARRHAAAHQQVGYLAESDMSSEQALQNEIIRGEVLQAIYQEIEELPDQARKIFKLIFIENLPTHEIAERLGLNPQTVRSQKFRAVQLIRTALLKKNHVLGLLFLAFVLTEHEAVGMATW